MWVSLYTQRDSGRHHCRRESESTVLRRWHRLPQDWRDLVVVPLHVDVHEDYEIAASRALGYDEDEKPCFCTHDYVTGELLSDDDEEFYEVVTYAESLAAWRLRDGRWLIHRRIVAGLDDTRAQSFYSLSETMPR